MRTPKFIHKITVTSESVIILGWDFKSFSTPSVNLPKSKQQDEWQEKEVRMNEKKSFWLWTKLSLHPDHAVS